MKPALLVLTTAHWPDDPRIRERLIRTLAPDFDVTFATQTPGPTDQAGLRLSVLRGGRLMRNIRAFSICLRGSYSIVVLHDPETLVAGLLTRLIRRRTVVFDVHEDFPAAVYTRAWVPVWLRAPLAAFIRLLLRFCERFLVMTLAEAGYANLFRRSHVVFPNYPDTSNYPSPSDHPRHEAVYVGDVTLERGLAVAVEACTMRSLSVEVVGRVSGATRQDLVGAGGSSGDIRFWGYLPNRQALALVARSRVALSPIGDLPNYRNSQPTKILEYLAVGVPVVASDLPGTRSLTRGLDSVFLFEPGNPHAMADALDRALMSGVRERAALQSGEIRKLFRWPADEVRAFYRSLLGP